MKTDAQVKWLLIAILAVNAAVAYVTLEPHMMRLSQTVKQHFTETEALYAAKESARLERPTVVPRDAVCTIYWNDGKTSYLYDAVSCGQALEGRGRTVLGRVVMRHTQKHQRLGVWDAVTGEVVHSRH